MSVYADTLDMVFVYAVFLLTVFKGIHCVAVRIVSIDEAFVSLMVLDEGFDGLIHRVKVRHPEDVIVLDVQCFWFLESNTVGIQSRDW